MPQTVTLIFTVGKTKLPLSFIFLFVVDRIKVN